MKCSIIGAGRMGKRHIQAVKNLGLDLVGLVDLNLANLEETKKEFNLPDDIIFKSIEDMYSSVIPDCVIISTTADSHCELTCNASNRGVKYILVEKPISVSVSQAKIMIETCKCNGTLLSVNHQMRFMEQYTLVKEMINNETFGGFQSMTIVGGNIGMSMNGSHYFEAFRYISEDEPHQITAWFDDQIVNNPRGNRFQDRSGSIRVSSKTGKKLYIEISTNQGHGLEVIYAARNGIIKISELTGELIAFVRKSEYKDLPTTRYGMPSEEIRKKITPAEVVESSSKVLEALISDTNRVTGEDGLLALKVLVGAYVSAENFSKTIKFDELLENNNTYPWA